MTMQNKNKKQKPPLKFAKKPFNSYTAKGANVRLLQMFSGKRGK